MLPQASGRPSICPPLTQSLSAHSAGAEDPSGPKPEGHAPHLGCASGLSPTLGQWWVALWLPRAWWPDPAALLKPRALMVQQCRFKQLVSLNSSQGPGDGVSLEPSSSEPSDSELEGKRAAHWPAQGLQVRRGPMLVPEHSPPLWTLLKPALPRRSSIPAHSSVPPPCPDLDVCSSARKGLQSQDPVLLPTSTTASESLLEGKPFLPPLRFSDWGLQIKPTEGRLTREKAYSCITILNFTCTRASRKRHEQSEKQSDLGAWTPSSQRAAD